MASKSLPLITLTTDFGLRDPYVASMKGVIYSENKQLTVVDLSHQLDAQDVLGGALFLAAAVPYYPKGTIHAAVVDPGVGTDRHPIALSAGGQILVCPDNGLATLFLRDFPLQEARIITNPRFMRKSISPTFHGRDVFAPVAASLACGVPLGDLGQELDAIVTLDLPRPRRVNRQRLEGEIVHVDHFGNLITNIHYSLVGDDVVRTVRAGRHVLRGVRLNYAGAPAGSPLTLFGGYGYLEIAINGASARDALRLGEGQSVIVECTAPDGADLPTPPGKGDKGKRGKGKKG